MRSETSYNPVNNSHPQLFGLLPPPPLNLVTPMFYRVGMNTFIESLKNLCREHLLEEKRLLAPNLRTGHQWLESVARAGQPVVNVHIKTLHGLTMDLAGPEVAKAGLKILSPLAAVFLMEKVWRCCQTGLEGYLASVRPGARFFGRLHKTLLQIRLAGETGGKLNPRDFEVEHKGREIAQLLMAYEEELKQSGWVDYAQILKMALDQLRAESSAREGLGLVAYPADQTWSGLEKDLIEAIPLQQKIVLLVDPTGETPSMSFFRAVGEVNEVREVVRRCLEREIPLDQVEIILSNSGAYIPLFHELSGKLKPQSAEHTEETEGQSSLLQLTFAEGLPARYSRPARALSAWLEWTSQDAFLQPVLVQMIRDGLLDSHGEGISYARLADTLQALLVGHGRDRYLMAIDRKIRSLEAPRSRLLMQTEEDEPTQDDWAGAIYHSGTLRVLRPMVDQLLAVCPKRNATPLDVIKAAISFLDNCAHKADELDQFAMDEYRQQMDQAVELLDQAGEESAFDAREWLASLSDSIHLMGSGPRPGHAHVSSLMSGGHSGRPYTFILGMDDGRFPGGGSQDPLLLDSERRGISPDLPTTAIRLQERVDGFHRLLSRLRGEVTLSYCCRDLLQDQELFESPALLGLRERAGQGNDVSGPVIVSFAPANMTGCLSEEEWWLLKLASRTENTLATGAVGLRYRHLNRGLQATAKRNSLEFTQYDGFLGAKGELDPRQDEGPVLSANGLQMIGKCPLAYFFHYGLHIKPPEETVIDPDVWLDSLSAGNLLHEVFREFMAGLTGQEEQPSFKKHWGVLIKILNKRINEECDLVPPLNEAVLARQKRDFQTTARVFLIEEENYASQGKPVYLEASIGLPPQDLSTELDTKEPVRVHLPGGTSILARGRIDRIDQTPEGHFRIWDYKTGSATYYEKDLPYKQGRLIQHALYIELLRKRLTEMKGLQAEVEGFGFFFPGKKARGRRITWETGELGEGCAIMQSLCQIVSEGAFLASCASEDCGYCDYKQVCHPLEETNLRAQAKLENLGNEPLDSMRKLRGIGNE